MVRRLLALTLLLSYAPFMEAAEWAAHFATHGDFAHAADAAHERPGADEHGCIPTLHLCGCHSAPPSTARVEAREGLALERLGIWLASRRDGADRTLGPPPLRPPIS